MEIDVFETAFSRLLERDVVASLLDVLFDLRFADFGRAHAGESIRLLLANVVGGRSRREGLRRFLGGAAGKIGSGRSDARRRRGAFRRRKDALAATRRRSCRGDRNDVRRAFDERGDANALVAFLARRRVVLVRRAAMLFDGGVLLSLSRSVARLSARLGGAVFSRVDRARRNVFDDGRNGRSAGRKRDRRGRGNRLGSAKNVANGSGRG